MPRNKAFNPTQAVDQAMRVFWQQGYTATSIQELLEAMELHHGSLYNAFGDKHHVFLAALEHYRDLRACPAIACLKDETRSPVATIEDIFQHIVEESTDPAVPCGCLMTNTLVELVPHDPIVAEFVLTVQAEFEQALYEALIRAQQRGEISQSKDPRAFARFLVSARHGIRVMARGTTDRATLQDIADVTLTIVRGEKK